MARFRNRREFQEVATGHAAENVVSLGQVANDDARSARLYADGMALVDRTAAYLDGAGRRDARTLIPAVGAAYATESMRLTTLLMNLSSWLIMRRALGQGALNLAEARVERARVRFDMISRPSHNLKFTELPERLQDLVHEALALRERVVTADRFLFPKADMPAKDSAELLCATPVAAAIERIETAFSRAAG